MIEANKALVLGFLTHAFANRMDDALALLHPEATWWVAGDPQRLRVAGLRPRARIDRLLEGVKLAFPAGLQMSLQGITAEADRVAVEVQAQGARGDGRTYHNRYHFLCVVREGRVVAVREYMDTLHLYEFSQP